MTTYTEIPFPVDKDIVYQIGIAVNNRFFAFYVGQSSRNIGRFGDYVSAKFSASTDFKVGEAIRYLSEKNYKVTVRYKPSNNKSKDEMDLINHFRAILPILNDIKGYDYKSADETIERKKVHDYVDKFLTKVYEMNKPSS